MFSKIIHWSGIVVSFVLKGLGKAETEVDKLAPEIEKAMQEGATVASFIPGIGPEVAAGLNLGAELTGALDKVLHYTDAEFQTLLAQLNAALPANSGYSVLLIPAQLKADAEAWFAQVQPTIDAVKTQAQAITGNAGAAIAKATS
jgi:hypothetical protein